MYVGACVRVHVQASAMDSSTDNTKVIVASRLRSGEYFICDKKNQRNSPLWKDFRIVCSSITGDYVNFVQCVKCKAFYYCSFLSKPT